MSGRIWPRKTTRSVWNQNEIHSFFKDTREAFQPESRVENFDHPQKTHVKDPRTYYHVRFSNGKWETLQNFIHQAKFYPRWKTKTQITFPCPLTRLQDFQNPNSKPAGEEGGALQKIEIRRRKLYPLALSLVLDFQDPNSKLVGGEGGVLQKISDLITSCVMSGRILIGRIIHKGGIQFPKCKHNSPKIQNALFTVNLLDFRIWKVIKFSCDVRGVDRYWN